MELKTVTETANFFNVSTKTIYRWIGSGKIKCIRIGKCVRISNSEIERIIKGEK